MSTAGSPVTFATGSGESARVPTAMVLGICALVLAPTLTYRMGVDQGVFAYMGAGILERRWPYLQTWENDFPGLMFLQALHILVFGKSIAMFRLLDLLFQLGNAFLIFRLTTRLSGKVAGYVAAVIFCLIYQGYGPWNTAQREGFGLLFVLAGFWLYFTAERRSPLVTSAGVGLGLGVAVTIKPNLLALAAFYAPLATHLRSRAGWVRLAVAGACAAAPAATIVIGYWALGGLTQLIEACVTYQAIYTARLRGDAPLATYWLGKLARLGRNAVVLPIIYIPFLFAQPARRDRLMLWLALLGAVYGVFVQGTFAGYHYLPGLGVGSILIGDMFSLASARVLRGAEVPLGRYRVPAQLLVAHLLVAAAAVLYLHNAPIDRLLTLRFMDPPVPGEFRNNTVFDFTEDYDVAAYLRERTQPHESIQVWGYEPLVYYLAERYASSRFHITHPLVIRPQGGTLAPMQLRWRHEFIQDIERQPPVYVVVVRHDNWWWAPEERTSEELLDDFPEWKRLIQRDYGLEHTVGRFLIYRRMAGRAP